MPAPMRPMNEREETLMAYAGGAVFFALLQALKLTRGKNYPLVISSATETAHASLSALAGPRAARLVLQSVSEAIKPFDNDANKLTAINPADGDPLSGVDTDKLWTPTH